MAGRVPGLANEGSTTFQSVDLVRMRQVVAESLESRLGTTNSTLIEAQ